jgi:hypothetical protein
MPLTAGEVVFAIDEDHIESVPDATALTRMGFTSTITELNYTDGVTSAIQTQLDAKQPLDSDLTAIAALTTTATGRSLLAIADAAAGRTILDAAPATPTVNAQTGTTYTLQASDNGKIVTLSNASGITVTVPSGLGAGFHCQCIQIGAGQVTFSPSSTTVNNRQSHTKIAGQYGVVGLSAYASNVFALAGDTAA